MLFNRWGRTEWLRVYVRSTTGEQVSRTIQYQWTAQVCDIRPGSHKELCLKFMLPGSYLPLSVESVDQKINPPLPEIVPPGPTTSKYLTFQSKQYLDPQALSSNSRNELVYCNLLAVSNVIMNSGTCLLLLYLVFHFAFCDSASARLISILTFS